MVEVAMVLPAVLALISGCIDASRYVYITSLITTDTNNAARLAALPGNQGTDCPSLAAAKLSGGGFTITQDSASVVGDTSNGYTTPPTAGSGYVYIYPAVATSTLTCAGANRTGAGSPASVTVRTTFKFLPLTPYMSKLLGNMIITASSTVPTGY